MKKFFISMGISMVTAFIAMEVFIFLKMSEFLTGYMTAVVFITTDTICKEIIFSNKKEEKICEDEELINKVIDQIEKDFANKDKTAVYEMLQHTPKNALEAFLPE